MADETCRAYEVDGEPVVVHGDKPLDALGKAALTEVVRAAKKLMAEEHPHAGVIQELIAAARHAAWCIPDGMVPSKGRCELADGFEVKTRLKAAVQAAREALTPAPAESIGDVRALAVEALNAKFDCANSTIALDPPELRHLTATKTTGPGLLDWQKLTLGEIVDCLAEAGLLTTQVNAPLRAVAESVHPGEILREELAARGLTQTAFAEKIDRPIDVVNRIIKGKKNITPDTALDLERGLGVSAGFWVRLQAEHDLHLARQRRGAAVVR